MGIKKIYIINFFVICIFGTILHFTYDFSNQNLFVGIFSAVNESVWEHIKLIIVPMIFLMIFEIFGFKLNTNKNYYIASLIKFIFAIIFIPLVFYTYTYFLKTNNIIIDILSFYITIAVSQLIAYKIVSSNKEGSVYVELVSKITITLIFLLFVIFTFYPPKLEIFKDSTNNTYGIYGEIK